MSEELERKRFVPATEGTDIKSSENGTDGHVRLEEDRIMVDLFDSSIEDPDEAWIVTEQFPNTPEGRKEANEFLREEKFNAELIESSVERKRLSVSPEASGGERKREKCRRGEEWVEGYVKEDGTEVRGYCRITHPNLSRRDRRIDSENIRRDRRG